MSRILFLSGWFPFPADNGSKIRIANLLRGLASEYQVTLLSFADKPAADLDVSAAKKICDDVQIVPWQAYNPNNRRARLGMFSVTPRSILDTFSPEMQTRIERTLGANQYDLVIASQLTAASYAPYFGNVPAIFEEPEVGLLYEKFANAKNLKDRLRHGLTWEKHRRYVASVMRRFRACTVVSNAERELLRKCAPEYDAVHVIPNAIDLNEYTKSHAAPQPNTLIFTGSFRYFVNHEAMTWFVGEVYPRVQAEIPDVRLTITGDHANLGLPQATNVTLTGVVDDVRSLIASSWISLAPILQGGGTRLKIVEAMALRTPVVATSKGAEGLDARHNEHLLIADEPDVFAREVVRLLRDPGLRERLTNNAYQLVREKFDWSAVLPRFLQLVREASIR